MTDEELAALCGADGEFNEPLSNRDAERLAKRLIQDGTFVDPTHLRREMAKDDLKLPDVLNVVRCGSIVNAPERENGSWRYRIQTSRIVVVIAFEAPDQIIGVTAWRLGRR